MANWLIYLKERFPLAVYALLVGGLVFSGQFIASSTIDWLGAACAFVGLMWFFGLLRLMDELKDYDKDVIAHPTRPLPRGVLSTAQVRSMVGRLSVGMLVLAALIGLLTSGVAGALYFFVALYLWLMYQEFYAGTWLAERPLLYAVSHQIILLPICMFTVAVSRPELAYSFLAYRYGFCVLGAFFAYEVCRKLDPKAHPILKTYLAVYGAKRSSLLVIGLNVIAGLAAWRLGLGFWLWPFELLLVTSLGILFKAPEKHKFVETAATLSLLFHIWAITFRQWLIFFGVLS